MDLVASLFRAILTLGLPVAAITFGLVGWAIRAGVLDSHENMDSLRKSIRGLRKRESGKRRKINPVHDKWLKFGGGFYGVVALYTYFLIEWDDFWTFVKGLGHLVLRLDIGVLVNFLVNSITNFVGAIAWPAYWAQRASSQVFWVWILLAYGAYWLGMTLALRHVRPSAYKEGG